MSDQQSSSLKPTRTDVGYGRPPKEHQFKKGQPRPPRKAKAEKPPKVVISEILRELLQERRRMVMDGEVKWPRTAEVLIRKAYQEAHKGDAVLLRDVMQLLFAMETEPGEPHLPVVCDPDGDSRDTGLRLMPSAQKRAAK